MRLHLHAHTLAFACGLASVLGCAPQTPYRYTAMVPPVRPIAWDGRTARPGTLRLEGNLAANDVIENLAPQVGDTALLVPKATAGGAALLTVTSGFELGVRGEYAAYAWNIPSAVGTMPLPNRPSVWGIGPEFRGAFPLDKQKKFALGFAANVMHYNVPSAEWVLTGPGSTASTSPCVPSPTCVYGYQLASQMTEGHWDVSLGIYPSYGFGKGGEYGHIYAMLGAHTGYSNEGFTNVAYNGSTLSTNIVFLTGFGYGVELSPFHVAVMIIKPLTDGDSAVNYGFGSMLTAGLDLPLWSNDGRR
jgi:hypothetical protein